MLLSCKFFCGSRRIAKMTSSEYDVEKKVSPSVQPTSDEPSPVYGDVASTERRDVENGNLLKRDLSNRHMQMIAIGM